MAKRGDPSVLRYVVNFLRFHSGVNRRKRMTQAEFGRACRLDQSEISRFELGKLAPSEEQLRRMAKVAAIEWSKVGHIQQFFSSLVLSLRQDSVSAETVGFQALETVMLALRPYLLEACTLTYRPAAQPTSDEEQREAEQIWTALERHPVPFRRRLIEVSPDSGNLALAVQVCKASVKSAARNGGEAQELAELAVSIADRFPGEDRRRLRLQGYCWAHVANARRVANDLAGADEAFARAWDLWRAGAGAEHELLAEWRLYDLEGSLRRAQRRFSEALELLDRARVACQGDPLATGRILLNRERVFNQKGDIEGAFETLKEAAPLVEASADSHLIFALRFNMADDLCHLERYQEARESLPLVRELAFEQANELDLIRVGWLTAKVAAGEGRAEEAIAGLEQVRREFTARGMPYDAALSSLDLSVLWLKAGRSREVKQLAVAMGWIFKAQGIDREALAALEIFCAAARQEKATVELARRIIADIEQARRSAPPNAR